MYKKLQNSRKFLLDYKIDINQYVVAIIFVWMNQMSLHKRNLIPAVNRGVLAALTLNVSI